MNGLVKAVCAGILALSSSVSFAVTKGNVQCLDINGQVVGKIRSDDPRVGVAYATVQDGMPVIVYYPQGLDDNAKSVDTNRFIMLHECGHCALGHIYTRARDDQEQRRRELQADCFAAKNAARFGINIQNVLKDVMSLPDDPTHPSGYVRGSHLKECYEGTSGQ